MRMKPTGVKDPKMGPQRNSGSNSGLLRAAQGGSVLLMPDAVLYSYSLGYVLMA